MNLVKSKLDKKCSVKFTYLSYAFTNKTLLLEFSDHTKYVAKVCIKEDRFSKIELEAALLEKVGLETIVPVPKVIYKDFSQKEFQYPFAIYSFLKGKNLVDVIQDVNDYEKLGEDLAYITFQLHQIVYPMPLFSLANKQEEFSSWTEIIRGVCEEGIKALYDNNFKNASQIEKKVTNSIDIVREPVKYSLIHRDLQPQNVHWDTSSNKIIGVFDFESAGSGDFYFEFNFLERKLFKQYPMVKKAFYKKYNSHTILQKDFEELVKFYEIVRELYFFVRNAKYNEFDRQKKNIEALEELMMKS